MKKTISLSLTLLLLISGGWLLQAQSLSGDDILLKSSQQGGLTAPGSRISSIGFDILNNDGTTSSRRFAFFSKRQDGRPDKLLIFFLAPELERGTIFLSVDPLDPTAPSRLWLFLSALGQVKELVSNQDRSAGFAGSNLKNDQIGGGFNFSDDYTGELLGQEELSVTWLGKEQTRSAFKVALTQKPNASVDFPSGTVWIDTQTFVVLKGELVNAAGALEQVSTLNEFVEFDGSLEPSTIVVEDVLDNSKTTISIGDRQKVDNLPDEIFTPEGLPGFDPTQFGVTG